jgi:hypothetical protein
MEAAFRGDASQGLSWHAECTRHIPSANKTSWTSWTCHGRVSRTPTPCTHGPRQQARSCQTNRTNRASHANTTLSSLHSDCPTPSLSTQTTASPAVLSTPPCLATGLRDHELNSRLLIAAPPPQITVPPNPINNFLDSDFVFWLRVNALRHIFSQVVHQIKQKNHLITGKKREIKPKINNTNTQSADNNRLRVVVDGVQRCQTHRPVMHFCESHGRLVRLVDFGKHKLHVICLGRRTDCFRQGQRLLRTPPLTLKKPPCRTDRPLVNAYVLPQTIHREHRPNLEEKGIDAQHAKIGQAVREQYSHHTGRPSSVECTATPTPGTTSTTSASTAPVSGDEITLHRP